MILHGSVIEVFTKCPASATFKEREMTRLCQIRGNSQLCDAYFFLGGYLNRTPSCVSHFHGTSLTFFHGLNWTHQCTVLSYRERVVGCVNSPPRLEGARTRDHAT